MRINSYSFIPPSYLYLPNLLFLAATHQPLYLLTLALLSIGFSSLFCGVVIIDEPESFQDLFSRITLRDLYSHQFDKNTKLNDSLAFAIHLTEHFLDFFFLWFKIQSSHGYFKLFCINMPLIERNVLTPSVSKRPKAYLMSCF